MSEKNQEVLDLQPQEQSLALLSPFETRVAALVAETKDLTIKGVEDREGLKAAHEARMELKATRVEIDHTRKEMIAPALEWQRKVNDLAKDLTNQIQPIEKRLQEEEDKIKSEKKRLKEEQERARLRKLQERGSFLISNGGSFNGTIYEPGLSYEVELSEDELLEIEDDKWEDLKEEILEYQSHLKAQEQRIRVTRDLDRLIKDLGFVWVDERNTFSMDYVEGTLNLTVEEYQETLEECISENWEDNALNAINPPPKIKALYKRVNAAKDANEAHRLKEQEKQREALEQLERQKAAQAKKEAELKAKEEELAREKEKAEALNVQATEARKQVKEVVDEFVQEDRTFKMDKPKELPKIEPQGMDPELKGMILALCEKITSKPFLSAQLPEAQEILERLKA